MTKKMEDKSSGYVIPESILSDLCSRFIINVPEEERNDLIRIFFQIEIAHWFYLDFYCESSFSSSSSSSSSGSSSSSPSSSSSSSDDNDEENDTNLVKQRPHQSQYQLKPCSIRTFAENIFRHCPFLMQHSNQLDEILSKWKVFKHAVPTNGAIILDESMRYVLLVQGFWAKASWGFPKGKVFEEETEAKCAIREVLEETGFDISNKLVDDEYLQININDQTIRLYIITDVNKSAKFEPKTRREIKEVRWFAIDELPMHRRDLRSKHKIGYSPNSFFMVIPFVKSLKKWIALKKGNLNGELVNGKIISANKSLVFNSNRPDASLIKHRRHNSHSHHQHHQHHHHQHAHNHSHHSHNNSQFLNNNNNSYSLQHYSNNSSLNSSYYRTISKSNDNLATLTATSQTPNSKSIQNSNKKSHSTSISLSSTTTSNATNSTSNTSNNAFLKHFSSSFSANTFNLPISNSTSNNNSTFSNVQQQENCSLRQQSQYYQKLQQNEFADLLQIKEAALANKTNKQSYNNNSNSYSKFKPVNNNINNNNNVNTKVKQGLKESTNSNLNCNNSARKRTCSNSMKHSASYNFGFNMTNNNNNYPNTTISISNSSQAKQILVSSCNQQANMSKAKKQLEFNGPECWINFKFDYDSIIQNLPPLFEL